MNVSEGLGATIVGRYALFGEIASGGMAAVHYGRLIGPEGFSRTVAIKRLHPHLARNPEFVAMFLDEARVAARVRHPNVVPTLDIVNMQGELFLVMEYVQGETLSRMIRAARKAGTKMPPDVAAAIVVGVLHGLHAAHEAVNERGAPLNIVHRDVSPQNILIGIDGIPRLVDFGVAKAVGRVQTTRDGQLKGKIAYMAPEQIRGGAPNRLVDIYASAIVFWEMLTGERLFGGDNDVTVLERALHMAIEPPSKYSKDVPPALDVVVLRGLERDPTQRFQSAREMAREIENVAKVASVSRVGEWVESIAGAVLTERAAKVAEIESMSEIDGLPTSRQTAPPEVEAIAATQKDEPVSASGAEAASDASLSRVPSTSQTMDRPQMRKVDRKILVGAAAAVCLLIAIVVVVRISSHTHDTAQNAPEPSAQATTIAVATSAQIAAPPPTQSSAPVETTAAAATHSPVVAHQSTATAAAVTTATQRNIVRTFPSATSGKPGCNPPYTIDANGVKQYKVECL